MIQKETETETKITSFGIIKWIVEDKDEEDETMHMQIILLYN